MDEEEGAAGRVPACFFFIYFFIRDGWVKAYLFESPHTFVVQHNRKYRNIVPSRNPVHAPGYCE